jgi:hypothetical protein
MSINARTKKTLPKMPSRDAWTEAWRKHWSKVGQPGYELPVGGRGGDERDFLTHARAPDKELARLKRINDEFIRGFKGMFHVGPAVTVFGSARFKPAHPYYKLARATRAELAWAGFATISGSGPGIIEVAKRGALKPTGKWGFPRRNQTATKQTLGKTKSSPDSSARSSSHRRLRQCGAGCEVPRHGRHHARNSARRRIDAHEPGQNM